MHYILSIAQNMLTRSFLGAQLMEEGFAGVGSADIAGAVNQLRDREITPL